MNCFVCGALKGATNHWWTIHLQKYQTFDYRTRLVIHSFADVPQSNGEQQHVCGINCTLILVERYQQSGTLEQPSSVATERPEGWNGDGR